MNNLDLLERGAAGAGLTILGAFNTSSDEAMPAGTASLALLGPDGGRFWPRFSVSVEAKDGAPDPMDRWSRRVIGGLARALGGKALFPFGGPPWYPFHSWAIRTGHVWPSPVSLLVHGQMGLMVSFRGAIALPFSVSPVTAREPVCGSCRAKPCRFACPAGALGTGGYDVDACHAYLETAEGATCMTKGCQVRAACPAAPDGAQPLAQAQLHMRAFHPK